MKSKISLFSTIPIILGGILIAAPIPSYGNTNTHPTQIKNGQICQAATECVADDGCSWISSKYDYWFAMGLCGTNGATSTDVCQMPWTKCRVTIQYVLTGCMGPSIQIETWQYGCNGTAG